MDKQRGFAPILIVLLIALGIGGYFVYKNYSNNQTKVTPPQQISQPSTSLVSASPVPSDTGEAANWKVYTNIKYGYSFKYPPKLTSIEISPDKRDAVVSIAGRPEGSTREGYYRGLFDISSFTPRDLLYDSDETAEELLDLKIGDQYKPPDRMVGNITRKYPTYKRLPDITIGGLQAKVFEDSKTLHGGVGKRFYVNKGNNAYLITSEVLPSQYYPQELYDQILSTFRFD